jgi:ParB family chromosome partitioning protein
LIPREFPAHFPRRRKRPDAASPILKPEHATMRLEFHQLDRRWQHLRIREPHRQRRLLASLAESGQQTPIIVVLSKEARDRYLVIDGHKRSAALQQLGRDTVEATVWEMSEAEALLLERSLRFSKQESALEQGWLLLEMEQRYGYSLEELARRFDRSISWVSRRLALVELLPEAIQQQVREGKIAAQLAMKYLAPVARVNVEHCERMAAAFVQHRCDTRQAAQLYAAWRDASRTARERILSEPNLFLKTQRQPPAARPAGEEVQRDLERAAAILRRASRRITEALAEMDGPQQEQAQHSIASAHRELDRLAAGIGKEQEAKHAEPGATSRDSGVERERSEQTRDRPRIEAVAPERTQGAAIELHERAGNPAGRESRTLPATDPRSADRLQGESRASPWR